MAYVAVDKDGSEWIYEEEPIRNKHYIGDWGCYSESFKLPNGSIEKLINKKLTFEDEPVKIQEKNK